MVYIIGAAMFCCGFFFGLVLGGILGRGKACDEMMERFYAAQGDDIKD